MRVQRARAKMGSEDVLSGVLMSALLVAGVLLSMGSAPTKHATFSIEAAKPEATESVSTTPDGTSPSEAIADRDVLDLQLD